MSTRKEVSEVNIHFSNYSLQQKSYDTEYNELSPELVSGTSFADLVGHIFILNRQILIYIGYTSVLQHQNMPAEIALEPAYLIRLAIMVDMDWIK